MAARLTESTDRPVGDPATLDNELLEDELVDLLAASIEARQLLWNLGPNAGPGLDKLLAELAQACLQWTDQIAVRLWERGEAPSTSCVRPLLRPDPSGGRRLEEEAAGRCAAHLTAGLAKRASLRAAHDRLTDADSRGLLGGIARELWLYAGLARQPERLFG
jgi:hypothetical protein